VLRKIYTKQQNIIVSQASKGTLLVTVSSGTALNRGKMFRKICIKQANIIVYQPVKGILLVTMTSGADLRKGKVSRNIYTERQNIIIYQPIRGVLLHNTVSVSVWSSGKVLKRIGVDRQNIVGKQFCKVSKSPCEQGHETFKDWNGQILKRQQSICEKNDRQWMNGSVWHEVQITIWELYHDESLSLTGDESNCVLKICRPHECGLIRRQFSPSAM
jgi:hypothetical protein